MDASIVANLDRGRVNETDSADLTTVACQVVQKRPQTLGEQSDEAIVTWCLRKLAIPVRDHLLSVVALEVTQVPQNSGISPESSRFRLSLGLWGTGIWEQVWAKCQKRLRERTGCKNHLSTRNITSSNFGLTVGLSDALRAQLVSGRRIRWQRRSCP